MTLFLTQFPVWSLQRTGRREQKGLRLQLENIVQLLHYFKEAVSPDFLDFFLHKSNPPGPLTMQAKNVQLKDQFSHSYYFLISQLTKKLTKHVGQQAENCSHLFLKRLDFLSRHKKQNLFRQNFPFVSGKSRTVFHQYLCENASFCKTS